VAAHSWIDWLIDLTDLIGYVAGMLCNLFGYFRFFNGIQNQTTLSILNVLYIVIACTVLLYLIILLVNWRKGSDEAVSIIQCNLMNMISRPTTLITKRELISRVSKLLAFLTSRKGVKSVVTGTKIITACNEDTSHGRKFILPYNLWRTRLEF
jgi:hypothetical protein